MDDVRFSNSLVGLLSGASTAALAFAILLVLPQCTPAQTSPLNQRVLVVYNSANSDSIEVANYYVARRGIPAANLCAIAPAATTWLNWTAFDSEVRTPIRNCLSTIG